MKKLLIAATAAFAFVSPAAAQPAPSHQGHPQSGSHAGHAGTAHAQHGAGHQGHAQHGARHADHAQHNQGGADHSKHADCCGDANGNGKMDCCEGKEAAQRPCCAKHQQHGQHGAQKSAPAQPSHH